MHMKDGLIRAAAATPKIRVADPQFNGERVIELMEEGYKQGAKLMVFPELCLTAYTCGDLFLQRPPSGKGERGFKTGGRCHQG